jgi:hypothetical protein
MHENPFSCEAGCAGPSVQDRIELLRAQSASLKAQRLALLSAAFEHRAVWDEWRWRRARASAGQPQSVRRR